MQEDKQPDENFEGFELLDVRTQNFYQLHIYIGRILNQSHRRSFQGLTSITKEERWRKIQIHSQNLRTRKVNSCSFLDMRIQNFNSKTAAKFINLLLLGSDLEPTKM